MTSNRHAVRDCRPGPADHLIPFEGVTWPIEKAGSCQRPSHTASDRVTFIAVINNRERAGAVQCVQSAFLVRAVTPPSEVAHTPAERLRTARLRTAQDRLKAGGGKGEDLGRGGARRCSAF